MIIIRELRYTNPPIVSNIKREVMINQCSKVNCCGNQWTFDAVVRTRWVRRVVAFVVAERVILVVNHLSVDVKVTRDAQFTEMLFVIRHDTTTMETLKKKNRVSYYWVFGSKIVPLQYVISCILLYCISSTGSVGSCWWIAAQWIECSLVWLLLQLLLPVMLPSQ